MKQIIYACTFLLFLSACWTVIVTEDSGTGVLETEVSAITSEPEILIEEIWATAEAEVPVEVNLEEVVEENAESGSESIVQEEQVDDVKAADVSEDTSGGQFIFQTDTNSEIKIYPIDHATAVVEWDDLTIYADPSSPIEWFESPDFVFVTHEHEDHFNIEALDSVLIDTTTFLTTQTVFDALSEELQENAVVMNNGDTIEEAGFTITAIPAYNIREEAFEYHPKGTGNGYVFEKNGFRMYFSGDSEDTPEMRALQDIDVAFVSMNLPFTMSVESAASAVLEFAPKKIFPYHYKWKAWLSDINAFKASVEAGNSEIEVLFWDWYAE